MIQAFLDTSYLLALEMARDENHAAAFAHWQRILSAPARLVCTTFVFDEVVTFLNSRGHHDRAVQLGNSLKQSPSVNLVPIDTTLFDEGWDLFCRHGDKRYSLTDCISFVVMRRLGMQTAFTFDQHFTQAGFNREP